MLVSSQQTISLVLEIRPGINRSLPWAVSWRPSPCRGQNYCRAVIPQSVSARPRLFTAPENGKFESRDVGRGVVANRAVDSARNHDSTARHHDTACQLYFIRFEQAGQVFFYVVAGQFWQNNCIELLQFFRS